MVQAPWTGTQSPTCPSPANFILLPSSWACSPVPPCRCLCQEPPSQIPLFLSLFSSLEAPLTVSTVCTQPRMNLRTLGLSVRSGHTPAAAKPHAHVCGFYVGRHTRFPYIPPPQKGPAGGPGMSPLPKASAGTVAGIQEVAMATTGPSCHLLQSALGPSHPLGFLEIC